jgi:hypothetical protein
MEPRMEFNLTTPALLFPAISLLMLAYTNRFLTLASVIRALHADYKTTPSSGYLSQIDNLRQRIRIIRNMQFSGIFSLLLCIISMFLLFFELIMPAEIVFSIGMLAMIFSLILSLVEIQMSVGALDLHLRDLEHPEETPKT